MARFSARAMGVRCFSQPERFIPSERLLQAVAEDLYANLSHHEFGETGLECLCCLCEERDPDRHVKPEQNAPDQDVFRVVLRVQGLVMNDIFEDQRIDEVQQLADACEDERGEDQPPVRPEALPEDTHVRLPAMSVAGIRTGFLNRIRFFIFLHAGCL
ncbi:MULTISPECIES: hypothetical protein [unclassified Methanoregula]|uniref:hypothetical protein n=1 Tax=unclassified Methanoregula TaxID=2649730 RepID=UPI0025F7DA02|nr:MULTISPECIES: hypothetical protein [unclassified Methanoregula]